MKTPRFARSHGAAPLNSQLIPLTRPAEAKAAGIPVETEHQLRWLERTADEKGLSGAFISIGRRKYIDPDKFHQLVRANG